MRTSGRIALPATIAGLIGVMVLGTLSAGSTFQSVTLALGMLAATLLLLRQITRRAVAEAGDRTDADVAALVVCWLILGVLPSHSFVRQSASGALTALSASSLIELAYFSVVAFFAGRILRDRGPSLDRSRPPVRLFVIAVWVAASAAWSASGLYAVVRAYQFGVIGVLGWATIVVVRDRRDVRDRLAVDVMRWTILVLGALAASGFVFGPVRSPAGEENLGRFSWIGAHPNVAGPLLVTALLFVVVAGERVRIPAPARAVLIAVFAAGIYENQSRSSLIGLAGACGILLVRAARRQPRTVAYATPFALLAGYIVYVFHSDAVWDYLSRDQSSERLANGNGRKKLWTIGLNSLDGPFDWIAGHGYGITRTLFLPEEAWAGSAHNSILAALVGLGVVGVFLLLFTYAAVARDVLRVDDVRSSPVLMALISVVLAGFLDAMFSDRVMEPTDGYAAIVLLAALTSTVPRDDPEPSLDDVIDDPDASAAMAADGAVALSGERVPSPR